ncbi:MAG: DinB family protein [Bacteroidia bacterium]
MTDWYLSVLEDISDKDGNIVLNDHTNSLEWLAGHLIVGRYRNMVRLGLQVEPYKNLDKFIDQTIPPPNAIAFDSKIKYPGLTECKEQWTSYSNSFLEALKNVNESVLKKEVPFSFPTGGNTVEDALAFVVMHETYHIGQMSVIRKSLGYPSMQLSPRK